MWRWWCWMWRALPGGQAQALAPEWPLSAGQEAGSCCLDVEINIVVE
jgi:hypothetical protein